MSGDHHISTSDRDGLRISDPVGDLQVIVKPDHPSALAKCETSGGIDRVDAEDFVKSTEVFERIHSPQSPGLDQLLGCEEPVYSTFRVVHVTTRIGYRTSADGSQRLSCRDATLRICKEALEVLAG